MKFLPLPRHCRIDESVGFVVPGKFRFSAKGTGNCHEQLAEIFEQTGYSGISVDSDAEILLRIDSNLFAEKPGVRDSLAQQGYRLQVESKGISITAVTEQGLFYGMQTFRQILEQVKPGGLIPLLWIEDWPELQWRGLQYDLARQMTYRREHMKDVIRNMAFLKLNMLHLYLEGRFAFPSHPELHQPGWMTPEDAQDLCSFAKNHHIVIIPQVNALGHMEQVLHVPELSHLREDPEQDEPMICPSHPETLPFIKSLLKDIMEAFDTPFIHVGMDEVKRLGFCERCRPQLIRDGHPGKLLGDYINRVADIIKKENRRVMIWGDMLLDKMEFPGAQAANGGVLGWGSRNMTYHALEYISKDIIICDWQYSNFTPRSLAHYRKNGFDVMPVTAVPAEHSGFHLPHFFWAGRDVGAIGAYSCTWELRMGSYFNNGWHDFAMTADLTWGNDVFDKDDFDLRYCRVFFGMGDKRITELVDGVIKNVFPPGIDLKNRLLNPEKPWAIFEPARHFGIDPSESLGDPSRLIGMKEAYLSQWERLLKVVKKRGYLLDFLDVPLRIQILALELFHLKHLLDWGFYEYAESDKNNPLVESWCKESLLNGLRHFEESAEILLDRFKEAERLFGSSVKDVSKTEGWLTSIRSKIKDIEKHKGLIPKSEWFQ